MGDADKGLGPLPRRQARQVDGAVFRRHVRRLGPRRRDDVAVRKFRQDVGAADAVGVEVHGGHGQEGLAVGGHVGARHEVQLAAGAADLPRPDRFGADLAVQVDGNAAVDGDEVVELADRLGSVDVVHGRRQNPLIIMEELVQLLRAQADGKHALSPLEGLLFISNFSRLIEL